VYNNHANNHGGKLFFDEMGKGLIRHDTPKHKNIYNWDILQRSFHWRPQAISTTGERASYQSASEVDQFIFRSNISRQSMLDTVQGHSPSLVFLPHVTNPELENALLTWSYFESIHSESYTHILRSIFNDPSVIFDEIPKIHLINDAGQSIAKYYDDMINTPNKENLVKAWVGANALEAIRFYVSFACTFSMGERGVLPQGAEIVRLIAQDEVLHVALPSMVLRILPQDDPEYEFIIRDNRDSFVNIFKQAAQEEKEWVDYLMQYGPIPGLNKEILYNFIDYQVDRSLHSLGLAFKIVPLNDNPLRWMDKKWLTNDGTQGAPQEQEITAYTSGAISNDLDDMNFDS
jgi:ribonucleoside-diphosphate reductase beta chain